MVSLSEMMRLKSARGQRDACRGAENFFGPTPFNIATEQFPVADGAAFPAQQRPERGGGVEPV